MFLPVRHFSVNSTVFSSLTEVIPDIYIILYPKCWLRNFFYLCFCSCWKTLPTLMAWKFSSLFYFNLLTYCNFMCFRSQPTESPVNEESLQDPSLYIGSYNQQLYIQESDWQLNRKIHAENPNAWKVAWKPYLISADSRCVCVLNTVVLKVSMIQSMSPNLVLWTEKWR